MIPKASPAARSGGGFLRDGLSRCDNLHSLVVRAVQNRGFARGRAVHAWLAHVRRPLPKPPPNPREPR